MDKLTTEQLYEKIMNCLADMEDIYQEAEGVNYKLDKEYLLRTTALNVVLVKNGSRLAYRESSLPSIANFVTKLDPELMLIPIIKEEPLIILRSNLSIVLEIVKGETDIHIIMAKLLGYRYVVSDWSSTISSYTVHYVAQLGNGVQPKTQEYILYSYIVPNDKYTNSVKQDISNDLDKFNSVLSSYGYFAKTDIWHND